MDKSALKQQVCKAIWDHADEIKNLGESILREPELGFKETKTAEKVAAVFAKNDIGHTTGHALTGVKGRLAGARARRTVAVMGELDAVTCFEHPHADPLTGAAHACGHFAQIAAMVGCGIGLKASGVMSHLAGDVVLFAVPAEEYVEIEYRNRLCREGKLSFLGGKPELIKSGDFDGIDMAMMIHLDCTGEQGRVVKVGGSTNGFVGKMARFNGREAHAAGAPHQGVNALNAAMLAIMAVNAQRETFRDEDYVRFHPIITKGGDLVNVVPSDVRMESYVRGRTVEAILDANAKVDRALKAGADAIGATVDITDLPGYLPMFEEPKMTELFAANAASLLGASAVAPAGHTAGSTDMGDLAHIMPIIQPYIGGVAGLAHTRDFAVVDAEMVYIMPALIMAMTVVDLLADDAAAAEDIMASFKPKMTKDSYLRFMEDVRKK